MSSTIRTNIAYTFVVVTGARQSHTRDIKQNATDSTFLWHAFLDRRWRRKRTFFSYAINRQPFGKRLAVGEHSYGGVRLSGLGRNTMGGDTSCIRRTASTILWASASWCAPCSQHAWWNHSRSRYTAGTFSGLLHRAQCCCPTSDPSCILPPHNPAE
jgi:hypothetical protein